jgi:hypothetical protein
MIGSMVGKLHCLFFAGLLLADECIQVAPVAYGRIEVTAFDTTGAMIDRPWVDLIEKGTGVSLKKKFNGSIAEQIPYGVYQLRVWATGFRTIERELRVYQPEIFARAELNHWRAVPCVQ